MDQALRSTRSTNSDAALALLDRLADTPGNKAKEQMVRENIDDPTFNRVLRYALDPYKRFGLAKLPEFDWNPGGPDRCADQFDEGTWMLLDSLAARDLTGNSAKQFVGAALSSMTRASIELFERIIKKDLRCKVTDTIVNKVRPGLIPCFDVMLAHPFEEKRARFPALVEPKLDGYRVIAVITDEVKFLSRSGIEFTTFDHLKAPVKEMVDKHGRWLHGLALDGEVTVPDGNFNDVGSALRKKNQAAVNAVFHVFDMLPGAFFTGDTMGDKFDVPLAERRAGLLALVPDGHPQVKVMTQWAVNSVAEIHDLYDAARSRGFEGLIVKDPHAPYEKKRSHAFMKLKAEESVDLRVTGVYEGKAGTKYVGMLGGFICDFNGKEVRVGGGFSDEYRKQVWQQEGESDPIGRLVEVLYHEVTPDGSLRHSRFKRFRDTLTGAKE